MKNGRPQAKDVSDAAILGALAAVRGRNGAPDWSALSDVQEHMADVPAKVVRAKLASMIRRKVITGCACGCRGDFERAP